MGKWAALGGARKKKIKVDQLVILKADELSVKKDHARLEKQWAQAEAKKIQEEAFDGDDNFSEDDEVLIKNTGIDAAEIRLREREKLMQARAKRQQEIVDAKKKRALRVVCGEILEMMKGRQFSETDVIVNPETMKMQTVLNVDIDISWADRASACETLWAFQFKGDPHKEVVVELGGVELLIKFLAEPPRVGHKDQFSLDAFCHHAMVCLRSLASHDKNVPHMVDAGVVQQMIKMVDVPEPERKILALETLATIAQEDKSTRKFLSGPRHRFLAKLLGDKRAGQQNFHRLVKSGLEACAMAALHLVEVLLTKDEHRLFVVNETFALGVIRNVMDSKNLNAQAMVCRMVMRLCQSDECRSTMQKMRVGDFAAEFFIASYSSESSAMACAALGSLVTSKDVDLAHKCLPRIWDILKSPSKHTSEDDRKFMEVPGAMRALRAFCKQKWVQDAVIHHDYLMEVIGHIANKEASHVTRAEAAHVLGSIALQTKHHTTIMSCLIPPVGPLMMLIFSGDAIQKFSAARAVQNLTFYPDYCQKFAGFANVDVKFDKKTGKDIVTRWNALTAVTNLCRPQEPTNCKTHGAGILRNFCSCENIRTSIMKYFIRQVRLSPGTILMNLAEEGNTLAARTHACAAIGNLCSTKENALLVCNVQAGMNTISESAQKVFFFPLSPPPPPFFCPQSP